MAYDEALADRVRDELVALTELGELSERKMFGGLAFMVRHHMAVGIVGDELMVRVGPDRYDDALARPHAREMDFTGKPMKGLVYVEPPGTADDDALRAWVREGVEFVATLPPKKPKAPKKLKTPKR